MEYNQKYSDTSNTCYNIGMILIQARIMHLIINIDISAQQTPYIVTMY